MSPTVPLCERSTGCRRARFRLPMDPARLRELLDRVQAGQASVDDAVHQLKQLPFADLGYALVDHHRALRQGAPEVILGQGKSPEQIAGIARELARTGQNVLVTRLEAASAAEVRALFPELDYKPEARVATFEMILLIHWGVCSSHTKSFC